MIWILIKVSGSFCYFYCSMRIIVELREKGDWKARFHSIQKMPLQNPQESAPQKTWNILSLVIAAMKLSLTSILFIRIIILINA